MDAITMNTADKSRTDFQVDAFNKTLNNGRVAAHELGKDDFMKILITQLQNQDPTKPMEDKEFIAQMAQFSTLEQMTNLSGEFGRMSRSVQSAQAFTLLGKNVEILDNGTFVNGIVEAVSGGDYPQLKINGQFYDYTNLTAVKKLEGESAQ